MMQTIAEFVKKQGIRITCNRISRNPYMPTFKGDHWEVILNILGKGIRDPMVTYYSKGFGHKRQRPNAEEVIECLASDSIGYENARNFEDWATELGYDTDSRHCEKIYHTIEKEADELRDFLGIDAYKDLLWKTELY